jgi:hypothetical protein
VSALACPNSICGDPEDVGVQNVYKVPISIDRVG